MSSVQSFFGGPLSTREKCKAAMDRGKHGICSQKMTNEAAECNSLRPTKQRVQTSTKQRLLKPSGDRPSRTIRMPASSARMSCPNRMQSSMKRKRELKTGRESGGPNPKQTHGQSLAKRKAITAVSDRNKLIKKETSDRENGSQRQLQSQKRVIGFFERMRNEKGNSFPNRQRLPRLERVSVNRPQVDDEMADFIVDGEDERDTNWRNELRKTTNYDPSKFKDDLRGFDDRSMESSLRQCWKEEQRSKCIGRLEDERELQREIKRKAIKDI